MKKYIITIFAFFFLTINIYGSSEVLSNAEKLELMRVTKKNTVKVICDNGKTGQQGSGFVIKVLGNKKIIATNAHVININGTIAKNIVVQVYASNKYLKANLIAYFFNEKQFLDIAFLVVNDKEQLLGQEVSLSDSVSVGDYVLAVGSPLEENFLTESGKVVETKQGGNNMLIMHDALTEHGNSGGGLFNSKGELVGINTYLHQNQNGIAVFSKILKSIKFYSLMFGGEKHIQQVSKTNNMWMETGIIIDKKTQINVLCEGTWSVNLGSYLLERRAYLSAGGVDIDNKYKNEMSIYSDEYFACIVAKIGKQEKVYPATQGWGKTFDDYSIAQFNNTESSGQLYFGLNIKDVRRYPLVGFGDVGKMNLTIMLVDSYVGKAAKVGSNTINGDTISKSNTISKSDAVATEVENMINNDNQKEVYNKDYKKGDKTFKITNYFEDKEGGNKISIASYNSSGKLEKLITFDCYDGYIDSVLVKQNSGDKTFFIHIKLITPKPYYETKYIYKYKDGIFTVAK